VERAVEFLDPTDAHERAIVSLLRSRALAAVGERRAARDEVERALGRPCSPNVRVETLQWAADLAKADRDFERAVGYHEEAARLTVDDGAIGRALAEVLERAVDGQHLRDADVAAANEAMKRAYAALDRLRRQLEDRVAERTRALADEVEIRREAELQAVRANQAKTVFLAKMSHELRTPLNAIIGYAELIEEELGASPDLEAIRRAGRHLLGMIDQVLDLTRIEAGHADLRIEEVDVDRLVDEVVAELGPLVAAGGNAVVRPPARAGRLRTDPLRLRQVLVNLVGNAAKFTVGGRIEVGARRDGPCLELWVEDTGVGIAADQLERVFEPFEQVDASSTRRVGGVGLGLSICRQLAELLGGSIRATSKLGRGSRFVVRIAG
jgi:signal transduction histidine kinase